MTRQNFDYFQIDNQFATRNNKTWLPKDIVTAINNINAYTVVFSGSKDGVIRAWNPDTGLLYYVLDNGCAVNSLVLSKDASLLITGGADGRVRVWRTYTGVLIREYERHVGSIESLAVVGNDEILLSGGADGMIAITELTGNFEMKGRIDIGLLVNSIAVFPDQKSIAVGTMDRYVRIISLADDIGNCIKKIGCTYSFILSVKVSPDGSTIYSGEAGGTCGRWIVYDPTESLSQRVIFDYHTRTIYELVLTRDGKEAITASQDHTVCVWSTETEELIQELDDHDDEVLCVALTKDGNTIVSGSIDNTVRVWDKESGVCKKVYKGHNDWVKSIAVWSGYHRSD